MQGWNLGTPALKENKKNQPHRVKNSDQKEPEENYLIGKAKRLYQETAILRKTTEPNAS